MKSLAIAEYDGKVVALIGRWTATEEGFWLTGECETKLKTGDYVWRNIIVLAYDPRSPSLFANGPTLEHAAANRKIAEMTARTKLSNDKLRWAVVYGCVETREELLTVAVGQGKPAHPAGYGHMAAAPARIVYCEKDVVILPR